VTPRAYRDALRRSWGALLAHHGQPTPIQLAAAEPLLAGGDVLIMAPTASGKTLAYVAPLAEKWCFDHAHPRMLLISPTRALANDLYRRIQPRLERLGIRCGRWTGDHRDGGTLQTVAILTPEGLDSRLSRTPHLLREVRVVVLDELHVLDGTARGDQLRVLLHRFRESRVGDDGGTVPLQVVAASATVPDPQGMAERYLRSPTLLHAGQRRKVRAGIIESLDPDTVHDRLFEFVKNGHRKVLLFVNRRRDAEALARRFRGRPPFGQQTFVHHGSLARARRLQVEQAFLNAPVALCVATSTLELGIDIGSIDLVASFEVPPDLASMLQRAGRGSRRSAHNTLVLFVSGPFGASRARTLLRAQRDGIWFPEVAGFRCSVLIQQAISALQTRADRTLDAIDLRRCLPPDVAKDWPQERLEHLLSCAAGHDWLEAGPNGRYRLGTRGEREWNLGKAHANIGDQALITVVDALTQDVVGHIEQDDGAVALGGQSRIRIKTEANRIVTTGHDGGATPTFRSAPRNMSTSLATAYLDDAGIPVPCVVRFGSDDVLFHGLGDAGGLLLATALNASGLFRGQRATLAKVGTYGIGIRGKLPESRWPTSVDLNAAVKAVHKKLARRLSPGRFHKFLPTELQIETVGGLCDLDAVQRLVAAGPPVRIHPKDPTLFLAAGGHLVR